MSTFPKIEQQFRDRFGYAPEIPFPFDPDSWAKVLKQCLDENSARPYREAFEYEKELLGDGEWYALVGRDLKRPPRPAPSRNASAERSLM